MTNIEAIVGEFSNASLVYAEWIGAKEWPEFEPETVTRWMGQFPRHDLLQAGWDEWCRWKARMRSGKEPQLGSAALDAELVPLAREWNAAWTEVVLGAFVAAQAANTAKWYETPNSKFEYDEWPRMCGVDRIVGEYLDATVTEPEGWGEV